MRLSLELDDDNTRRKRGSVDLVVNFTHCCELVALTLRL